MLLWSPNGEGNVIDLNRVSDCAHSGTCTRPTGLAGCALAVDFHSPGDFCTLPFTSFSATKFILEASDAGNTNFQALELMSSKISSGVCDQIYAKFPGGLNITAKVLKVGSDITLRVINSENFLVNVSILKIKT